MNTIITDQDTLDRWLATGRWEQFGWECRYTQKPQWPAGNHAWCTDDDHRPPADWTEPPPCETCDGNGGFKVDTAILYGIPGGEDWGEMCPDCGGTGKQRLAVQVPCYCLPIREAGGSWPYGDCLVPERCTDGLVTVTWATVEWGPLPVIETSFCPKEDTDPHICIDYGDAVLIGVGDEPEVPLPPGVDPQTLIGQWARGGSLVAA